MVSLSSGLTRFRKDEISDSRSSQKSSPSVLVTGTTEQQNRNFPDGRIWEDLMYSPCERVPNWADCMPMERLPGAFIPFFRVNAALRTTSNGTPAELVSLA